MVDNFKKHFLQGGLDFSQSGFIRSTVSIFNIVNFIILVSLHVSFLVEFIGRHPKGIIFSILFIGVIHFIIWLNKLGYYNAASNIFCFVLPSGVFLLAIGYSNVMFLDFYFVVFFLCIILFIRQRFIRMAYTLLYSAMYIWIQFSAQSSSLFGFKFDNISNGVLLLMFVVIFWILTYLLMSRLKEADDQKDQILFKLRQTNSELEVTTENMQRVSAMASHDLKTPIRNIKSMVGLIRKKSEDAALTPIINDIDNLAGNMINLIDQTIEHDSIKNLSLKPSDIDLNKVLDHISALVGDRFGQYQLKRGSYLPFQANQLSIVKILQNLIENGAKYNTSRTKTISVNQQIKGEQLIISVCDNGIGIDEKYRSQVFGMYTRLHNSDEFPGTGLGLAICRRITEQLSGSLSLEANEFGGSTFILSIPYRAVDNSNSVSQCDKASNSPGLLSSRVGH